MTLGALHIYPRISDHLRGHRRGRLDGLRGHGRGRLDELSGRGELSGGRLSGLSGEPLSAERLKHLHHQPALNLEQRDAAGVAQSIAGEVIAGEGAGGDGERPHGRQALSALNALKVADQTHAGTISEALEQLKGEGGGELSAGAGGGRDADHHLSGELDGEHGRVREGAGGEIEGGGGHRVQVDTEGRGEQGAGLDGGELSEGISGGGDIEGGADTLSASEGLSGGRLDHLSGRLSDDLADARGGLIIEGEPLTDLISGEGEALGDTHSAATDGAVNVAIEGVDELGEGGRVAGEGATSAGRGAGEGEAERVEAGAVVSGEGVAGLSGEGEGEDHSERLQSIAAGCAGGEVKRRGVRRRCVRCSTKR